MALLTTARKISRGIYAVQYDMTSGSAKLQWNVDGLGFKDIEDSTASSDTNFKMELPDCEIQAVTTGDASVSFNFVRRN